MAVLAALALLLGACTATSRPDGAESSAPSAAASSASSTPAGPSGSASSATFAPGLTSHSLTSGGRARSYLLYRPVGLSGRVPLVVMLHGGAGNSRSAASGFGWNQAAARGHFAVAYPDGLNRSWSVGGGCCGVPGHEKVNDAQFVVDVVHDVADHLDIDRRRVYASGISLGGLLAYRIACDTTTFAAIGPDSATLLGSCPSPHPISVIDIHGTADKRIPYDGSAGDGRQHIDGPSVPALNDRWRAVDHCASPAITKKGVVTTSLATCPDGRAVEQVTIAGAGHQWPGGRCDARCRQGAADPPSKALDATSTIWSFFSAHPAPE